MSDNSLEIKILGIPNKLNYLGNKFKNNILQIPKLRKNNGYGITFCYANNGSGKTSICREIFANNKYVNKKIEVFSYESHMFVDSKNQFIVGQNIREIENLKNNNNILFNKIHNILYNFYKYFSCYPKSDLYKIYVKKIKFYDLDFSKYKYNKNDSINIDIKNRKSQYLKFAKKLIKVGMPIPKINNIDFNKEILEINKSVNISNSINSDLWDWLNKKLNKFLIKTRDNIYEIKDQVKEINKINKFIKKENIDSIEEIYNVLKDLNSLDKCLICGNDIISFKKIKADMRKKINKIKSDLKKVKIAESINEHINEIEENDTWSSKCNFKISILKNLKKLLGTDFKVDAINECIKTIEQMNKIREYPNIFFEEYLLNVFFKDENNKYDFSKIIANNNEIEKYEKRKLIYDKKEFAFITKLIIENIGENRLKIDNRRFEITIDNNNLENMDSLKNIPDISSGEKNFIAISFALFSFLNKFKKGDFEILCFDDPFCSYDSNFKFQIIYLINLFANEKGLPIIVLTHSIDFFFLQKDSFARENNFYFLSSLKTEVNTINKDTQMANEFGFVKVEKDEINKISISSWIKVLKKEFELCLKKNNSENISFLIFSFIPFLRSIAYLMGYENTGINQISQLLHYECEFESKIDDNKIIDFLKFFLLKKENININSERHKKFWEEIVYNLKKISKMEEIKNIIDKEIQFLDIFFNGSKFIKYCFKLIWYSIYIRKTIEYKCLKDIDEKILLKYIDGKSSIWELINETKYINDNKKIEIKNIRLISNDILHQENNNNFISLALEISPKLLKKYIDILERIK